MQVRNLLSRVYRRTMSEIPFSLFSEPDGVKVRRVEFSASAGAPPNFSLLFFGDYHYQARAKRLIEIVTERRVTKPDLRHFCRALDSDSLLDADVALDLAGLGGRRPVAARYQLAGAPACTARSSDAAAARIACAAPDVCAAPDTCAAPDA